MLFSDNQLGYFAIGKGMAGSTTANCSSMNNSLADIGKLGVRGEESLY